MDDGSCCWKQSVDVRGGGCSERAYVCTRMYAYFCVVANVRGLRLIISVHSLRQPAVQYTTTGTLRDLRSEKILRYST